MTTNTFVDGKVHVRRRKCKTCIFLPGNRMNLVDGRVERMVAEADEAGSCIPCHDHLHQGAAIEPVCRGYFDKGNSWTLRLARAMGIVEFVDRS
jgi:hypothetical protein